MDELTPSEVQALTGKTAMSAQAAVLVKLGIPFRFGARHLAVARAVAEQLPQWHRMQDMRAPRLDMVR